MSPARRNMIASAAETGSVTSVTNGGIITIEDTCSFWKTPNFDEGRPISDAFTVTPTSSATFDDRMLEYCADIDHAEEPVGRNAYKLHDMDVLWITVAPDSTQRVPWKFLGKIEFSFGESSLDAKFMCLNPMWLLPSAKVPFEPESASVMLAHLAAWTLKGGLKKIRLIGKCGYIANNGVLNRAGFKQLGERTESGELIYEADAIDVYTKFVA